MIEVPKELLWYGKETSPEKSKLLHAGPLNVIYQNGKLRKITVGDHEILRMIYIALRDHNWATIIPVIGEERIEEQKDGFKISYRSLFKEGLIHLLANVTITGESWGRITFEFVGEVLSEFRTNRTGFCVLHPITGCAGNPCTVTHVNGKKQVLSFPEHISPHQPMKRIAAMSWKINKDFSANLQFVGEVFEMEDQRNWTDDTFKTYCRPLELPFPYTLEKGDTIRQKVVLSIDGTPESENKVENPYQLHYGQDKKFAFPDIGIGEPDSNPILSDAEIALIKAADFDYYEIPVTFESSWVSELNNAMEEAEAMGLEVYLKAYFSDNYEIEVNQLAKVIGKSRGRIKALMVMQKGEVVTTDVLISNVAAEIRQAFPGTKIGAGTPGFYAQINRNRVLSEEVDFITYSVNPQVHAFDNQTLVENLNGLRDTVKSAKVWAGNKSVYISRVTFKMQINPATTSVHTVAEKELPSKVDVRQMSLFGAGWALGSLKYLIEAGVGAVTYFETIGERGIIQGDSGTKYPRHFIVDKRAVFPMYYVFQEVLRHKSGRVLKSSSSHPDVFEGLVLEHNDKKTFLLANYTGQTIEVQIDGIASETMVRKLDEKNASMAMYQHEAYTRSPWCDIQIEQPVTTIRIRPFGLVFINESTP